MKPIEIGEQPVDPQHHYGSASREQEVGSVPITLQELLLMPPCSHSLDIQLPARFFPNTASPPAHTVETSKEIKEGMN